MTVSLTLGGSPEPSMIGLLEDVFIAAEAAPAGTAIAVADPESVREALAARKTPILTLPVNKDDADDLHDFSDCLIAVADAGQGDSLAPFLKVSGGCIIAVQNAADAISALAATVAVLTGGNTPARVREPDIAALRKLSLPAQNAVRQVLNAIALPGADLIAHRDEVTRILAVPTTMEE